MDKGDIAGWYKVVVEIKSGVTIKLPEWLAQLKAEKENAEANLGFVAIRPKGKPDPDDWYAVMPMNEFMELVSQAGYIK